MSVQVNITSIVGTPPFNVWVCDSTSNNNTCLYIATTINNSYSFDLPIEFQNASVYCIKIIDAEGCVE